VFFYGAAWGDRLGGGGGAAPVKLLFARHKRMKIDIGKRKHAIRSRRLRGRHHDGMLPFPNVDFHSFMTGKKQFYGGCSPPPPQSIPPCSPIKKHCFSRPLSFGTVSFFLPTHSSQTVKYNISEDFFFHLDAKCEKYFCYEADFCTKPSRA
jgi:hypothetical protein